MEFTMRKFTNYIAMKYAQGGLPEIEDIDLKALEITSEELQNRLDVSTSTANNWCAKRNPISKMGKLAIKYAIQKEITKISQKLQRKYSLFLDNGQYKIISSPTKDPFKVLAQTDDPKIARTVEYINVIYGFMQSYYEYLTHHIDEGDNKTELINLLDMIFYLETGDFYSQKYEEYNEKNIDITTSFNDLYYNIPMQEQKFKTCLKFKPS